MAFDLHGLVTFLDEYTLNDRYIREAQEALGGIVARAWRDRKEQMRASEK